MLLDAHSRPVKDLRISVTDKCNLRCRYCMPEEGVPPRRHEDLLSLEQLAEAARAAVGLGVTKIRLTGGEPLVRHRELSKILPRLSQMNVFSMVVTSAVIRVPLEWMSIPRVRVAVSIDGLPSTTTSAASPPPTRRS